MGQTSVNFAGLPKGAVLAALLKLIPASNCCELDRPPDGRRANWSRPGPEDLHGTRTPVKFLGGRYLHVDLAGDSFDPRKYDEYLGEGAAEAAIRPLREAGPDAWEFPETPEDGMKGAPFTRNQVLGACPNGSTIVKINTDLEDVAHHEMSGAIDGDRGIFLGSCLVPWSESGLPIPPLIVYYVERDHQPKVAYPVLAPCVAPIDRVGAKCSCPSRQ